MGVLFAGVVNSGLMSAWIFIFLDQEPEWRDKVHEELHLLLEKYAPASEGVTSPSERFSKIPPQAWENEMPILEVCVRLFSRLGMYAYVTMLVIGLLARDYPVSQFRLPCYIIFRTDKEFSLIFSVALLRRVTTGDIELSGKTIPNG